MLKLLGIVSFKGFDRHIQKSIYEEMKKILKSKLFINKFNKVVSLRADLEKIMDVYGIIEEKVLYKLYNKEFAKITLNEFRNLSKIIAAYLKIDFQTEVMRRLSNSNTSNRPVCFISDEYSEYVTATDANFFSQSREAKCINIISTQSYNSLLNTLNNKYSAEIIIQNLVNKLWFRTDDIYTIESAQKQLGKCDKEKYSRTISENAKQTNYNFFKIKISFLLFF